MADALEAADPMLATRTLIEQYWDITLPDRATASAEDGYEFTRLGLPASDMTGDGLPDTLSYEVKRPEDIFSTDYTYSVYGVRGTNGATLWERHFPEYFDIVPIGAPDLSGDGRGDVIVLTFDKEKQTVGTCGSAACVLVEEQQHRWNLYVLSGADGTNLWTWELEGLHGGASVALSNIPPSVLTSDFARTTTAAAVLPIISGDHDGDGLPDLILNTFDRVQTGDTKSIPQSGVRVFANDTRTMVATNAEVLTGDSGAVLLERTQDLMLGGATLLPAGDVMGSAVKDLQWQVESHRKTPRVLLRTPAGDEWVREAANFLDLEMIDGQTLDTVWEKTITRDRLDWILAESSDHDLNGDGREDLLLFEREVLEDDATAWTMGLISGSDGSVVWRKPVQDYPDAVDRTVIGSVGGGPGKDIVMLELVLLYATQEFQVIVRRLDGATGAELLNTERIVSAQEGFILTLSEDADRDGVLDVLFEHVDGFRDDESGEYRFRSLVTIESGATGEVLYAFDLDGAAYPSSSGDVDGDGRADVVMAWIEAGMQVTRLAMVSPATDRVLWEVSLEQAPFEMRIAPSLSRESGFDLLVSRTITSADDDRSRVDALDGLRGGALWDRGDTMGFQLVCSGASCV